MKRLQLIRAALARAAAIPQGVRVCVGGFLPRGKPGPGMKTLDLEQFRAVVDEFKDDLQREANRWVLKKDVHQDGGVAGRDRCR